MERLNPETDGATPDIVHENIDRLREVFPDAFTESSDETGLRWKVDFEALQEILGDYKEEQSERYSFNWNGKVKARRIAQTPSTGTLRPCPEESVNWDSTENLFIEGDNLEVLKLLQKSYHKKVKMIYIDPPYNTGNDFIYPDNFRDNIKNYMELTGQTDEEGRKLSANAETSGRYHTDWLNMMYPRLKLARNLLRDDGVIFISIDDNEVTNLRKLCDEIFGEENFVSQLVWEKKKKGTFLSNTITNIKEYILVLSKNKPAFNGLIGEINTSIETYPCINASNKREVRTIPAGISSKYREKNHFLAKGSTISVTTMTLLLHSDLVIKDGILAEDLIIEGNWRYRQELMTQYAQNDDLYITQDLYLRRIVHEPREKTLKDLLPRVGNDENSTHKTININNLFADGWGSNEDGEEELRQLFGHKAIMDFPKPRKLLEKLAISIRDNQSLILDFFAGSCPAAHAILDLNKKDNGNRKFIMVQLPELCDEKSEAFKAGYSTIAEIGKERIRRAIKKIEEEQSEKEKNSDENLFDTSEDSSELDLGFKVFKLDSSNIKPWDADFDNLKSALLDTIENIKLDRSEADVLYELLLKYGLDLTIPIEEHTIADRAVYVIGGGALIVCLSEDITLDVVEGIASLNDEFQTDFVRVVFKDSGFADDVVKTNAMQILVQAGIEDVKSL